MWWKILQDCGLRTFLSNFSKVLLCFISEDKIWNRSCASGTFSLFVAEWRPTKLENDLEICAIGDSILFIFIWNKRPKQTQNSPSSQWVWLQSLSHLPSTFSISKWSQRWPCLQIMRIRLTYKISKLLIRA